MQSITCYPELPHPNAGIWRHAALSGCQVTDKLSLEAPAFAWVDCTWRQPIEALEGRRAVNGSCRDISKETLERVYFDVTGVCSFVDPESWPVVYEKANENARKDGRVLVLPQAPEPGRVYQQYLVGEEYRVWVMGAMLPAALCRNKAVRPGEIFSAPEIAGVVTTLRRMGADYAEVDIIRERSSGELFLIDVNITPWFGAARAPSLDHALVLSWCRMAFEALLANQGAGNSEL